MPSCRRGRGIDHRRTSFHVKQLCVRGLAYRCSWRVNCVTQLVMLCMVCTSPDPICIFGIRSVIYIAPAVGQQGVSGLGWALIEGKQAPANPIDGRGPRWAPGTRSAYSTSGRDSTRRQVLGEPSELSSTLKSQLAGRDGRHRGDRGTHPDIREPRRAFPFPRRVAPRPPAIHLRVPSQKSDAPPDRPYSSAVGSSAPWFLRPWFFRPWFFRRSVRGLAPHPPPHL